MGEAFFLAVGTKHVRLASTDGNVKEIGRRIRNAWGVGEDKSSSTVGEQFLTISLLQRCESSSLNSTLASCVP
jgi:hypothetical protein